MASEDFGKLRSHMELEGQRNLGKNRKKVLKFSFCIPLLKWIWNDKGVNI